MQPNRRASQKMPVEVRYDDDQKVDEVVASDCSVHLERMDSKRWFLVLETKDGRGMFTIQGKCRVNTEVYEIDMRPKQPDSTGEQK